MKKPSYYVVIKPIVRNGREETVFPVISPTGEIYCSFTLLDAISIRGHAAMHRRKR